MNGVEATAGALIPERCQDGEFSESSGYLRFNPIGELVFATFLPQGSVVTAREGVIKPVIRIGAEEFTINEAAPDERIGCDFGQTPVIVATSIRRARRVSGASVPR